MQDSMHKYAAGVIELYNPRIRYDILCKYAKIDEENRVHIVVKLHRAQSFIRPVSFIIDQLDNIQAYTLLHISFSKPEYL